MRSNIHMVAGPHTFHRALCEPHTGADNPWSTAPKENKADKDLCLSTSNAEVVTCRKCLRRMGRSVA